MPQECMAFTMVTSISPTFCVPPLFIALVFGTPFDSSHLRLEFLAQLDGVHDVIEMPVGDEHGVHVLKFLVRFRTERIGQNPGIDQNHFAAGSVNAKCRMAQPGDFIAACVKHGCVPPVYMGMNC